MCALMPVCARVAQVGTSEAALVDLNYNTITHIQARARAYALARLHTRTDGAVDQILQPRLALPGTRTHKSASRHCRPHIRRERGKAPSRARARPCDDIEANRPGAGRGMVCCLACGGSIRDLYLFRIDSRFVFVVKTSRRIKTKYSNEGSRMMFVT